MEKKFLIYKNIKTSCHTLETNIVNQLLFNKSK